MMHTYVQHTYNIHTASGINSVTHSHLASPLHYFFHKQKVRKNYKIINLPDF